MMFLGNSRVTLGKNSSDAVVGVWEAVAPTDEVNGEYGITGTESEIYTMEWVQNRDILLVGGKFNNTINDSTVSTANSIAMFENSSGWTPLAGIGGVTAGVRVTAVGVNEPGEVYAIRDIRNASDTQMILIGGFFNFAGGLFDANDLNLAQYSIDSGWTGSTDIFRANNTVYAISNVDFDSTGITAYFGGEFDSVKKSPEELSFFTAIYRYNLSTGTSTVIETGLVFDNGNGDTVGGIYNDTLNNRLYLYNIFYGLIYRYDYTSTVEASSEYFYSSGVQNPPINSLIQKKPGDTYIYISTPDKIGLINSTPNTNPIPILTAPNQVVSDKITQMNFVDYNSGTYLLVGLQDNPTSNIKFYRVSDNSWQEKPVPIPDGLKGTNSKINSIVVDPATGTIYVGGKFSFVDANGNTAWNVAKFIPSASKFTPS